MAELPRDKLERWHDQLCSTCTKRKADKPNARCQIWHGLFVVKSKAALQNASMFVDNFGICKAYDPKVVGE